VGHKINDNWEALLTAIRFERGLSAIQPQTQRRPASGAGAGPTGTFASSENAFNDPVQSPYFGGRLAYNGTGRLEGAMVAFNLAYRYNRSAPTVPSTITTASIPAGQD